MANEPAQPAVNPVESFHKDITSSPKLAPEGNIDDFAKKFSQFKPPGAPQGPTLATEAPLESATPQEQPLPEVLPTDKPFESASIKKDKSFTGTLKSKAEEAEAKAARLEQELQELRNKELPRMQQELEEARLNVQNAENSKEAKQAKMELEALQAEHQRQQSEWMENQKKLQSELSFYNLEADPDFVSQVKTPREVAKTRAEKILGDNGMITEYRKAMNANFASLTAQDPVEQQRQAEVRDSILADLYNALDPFKQGQFTNIVNTAVLPAEENYVSALANHEVTKQQIEANRKNQNQQQQYQAQKRWKDTYDSTKQSVAKAFEIPEEVGRIIVSNNIPVDTSTDEMIAEAIIRDGGSQLPIEEVTRVIAEGGLSKKREAHIKGLQALVKEQQETINKLRGSTSSSETPTGGFQEQKPTFTDPRDQLASMMKEKMGLR